MAQVDSRCPTDVHYNSESTTYRDQSSRADDKPHYQPSALRIPRHESGVHTRGKRLAVGSNGRFLCWGESQIFGHSITKEKYGACEQMVGNQEYRVHRRGVTTSPQDVRTHHRNSPLTEYAMQSFNTGTEGLRNLVKESEAF